METQFRLLQSIRLKIFEMQLHPIIGIAVADSIDLILQPISIIDILVSIKYYSELAFDSKYWQ